MDFISSSHIPARTAQAFESMKQSSSSAFESVKETSASTFESTSNSLSGYYFLHIIDFSYHSVAPSLSEYSESTKSTLSQYSETTKNTLSTSFREVKEALTLDVLFFETFVSYFQRINQSAEMASSAFQERFKGSFFKHSVNLSNLSR